MKIAVFTSSYAVSPEDTVTAGIFVRDLSEQLACLGLNITLLTPQKPGSKVRLINVDEIYYPWLGRRKDLASSSMKSPITAVQYFSLLLSGLWSAVVVSFKKKPDVMLAMWAIPSGLFCWAAWKIFGIPYGVWALGSDIWARKKYPLGDSLVRRILKDAKFRFADGMGLSREVERISDSPCEFVPSVRFLPESEMLEPPPDGYDSQYCHFLYIGRYEQNKGPDILIEAVRLLIDRGESLHLHMFGQGSLLPLLEERACGYEAFIHINGPADPQAVVRWMKFCNWLVIPSRIESIPLILGDAIQQRIPVIVTDVGDMGEIVRIYQVGLVVPAAEKSQLVEAMLQARAVPRSRFSSKWELPLEVFSLEKSVQRCSQVLFETAEKYHRRQE